MKSNTSPSGQAEDSDEHDKQRPSLPASAQNQVWLVHRHLGSALFILELADTGRHGHTTCFPQQSDWNQHKSQLLRGHVFFSKVGGLFVGGDHT